MKDIVRFYDPFDTQPAKVSVTKEMKAYVKAARAKYLARLEEEKLEDKRKLEPAKQKDDKRERIDNGEKQSLAKEDEDLMKRKEQTIASVREADELLNDAT